jgi:ribose-phosphate pyrophosphokinase
LVGDLSVFSGNTHPELAARICGYLGVPVGTAEVRKFANDNTFVKINENVRGRDVFVVQPTCRPVNDGIMELLIMIDALKRASAGRITAVIPYYGYGRTDKKDQPRVPISAKLVANLITTAGADRVLGVDLHAGQMQGFFDIPVDEVTGLYLLSDYFLEKGRRDWVVVATDLGASKRARNFAERMHGAPLAIVEKRRSARGESVEAMNIIGREDLVGRAALIFDDEIDTAGSLMQAAQAVQEAGAIEIYAAATHPIFSPPAIERIARSAIRELVVTDTVPIPDASLLENLTILSIAPLLGETISAIHEHRSVGEVYDRMMGGIMPVG